MNPRSADGASQTENNAGGDVGIEDGFPPRRNHQGISRVRATLVETIARGKQDRLAVRRRVALSRVVSAFLVASTTASCVLLQRSGLVDLALGRMSVAIVGVLWFASTFTEAFLRDTRRACDGISLLCFVLWSFAHIMWRLASSEADKSASDSSGSTSVVVGGGDGTPAWVWVDMGVAWAIAPAAGGSLQLSLWGCIVPSWACVTIALAYGLRAEEVLLDGNDVDGALVLFLALTVCALVVLAVGYQVMAFFHVPGTLSAASDAGSARSSGFPGLMGGSNTSKIQSSNSGGKLLFLLFPLLSRLWSPPFVHLGQRVYECAGNS